MQGGALGGYNFRMGVGGESGAWSRDSWTRKKAALGLGGERASWGQVGGLTIWPRSCHHLGTQEEVSDGVLACLGTPSSFSQPWEIFPGSGNWGTKSLWFLSFRFAESL